MLAGQNGERLQYRGGPVQHSPELFILYWGTNFKSLLGQELALLFHNLQSENDEPGSVGDWQGILSQYYSNTPGPYRSARIAKEGQVTSVAAPSNLSPQMVEQELGEWIAQLGKEGITPTEEAQFIVLTPPKSTYSGHLLEFTNLKGEWEPDCGFHSATEASYGPHLQHYSYSVDPWQGEPVGCDEFKPKQAGSEEEFNDLVYSTTITVSHEFAESVTEPSTYREYPSPELNPYNGQTQGWNGGAGNTEIADLCPETVLLPYRSWVTELWDDEKRNSCAYEDPPYPQPPAPTVTTGNATSVASDAATITGSVDPNGPDTHYHFQFGESTSYGSSTAETDAGFGTTGRGASATIANLSPSTTYHYRVVATSWAGTSYGADQTLLTYRAATPVIAHEGNLWWVFYHGSDGALEGPFFNGKEWTGPWSAGGQLAPGTDPAIAREPNDWWAYYQGSDNALWELFFNGSEWGAPYRIGGQMEPGTNPAIAHEGNLWWVFYHGSDGAVEGPFFNGKEWTGPWSAGGQMGARTSPVIVRVPNDWWVFYQGSDGAVQQLFYNGKEWTGPFHLGGQMAFGTNPAVAHEGKLWWVFYQGGDGALWRLYFNGLKWSAPYRIGGQMARAADPVIAHEGKLWWVFYRGSDGTVEGPFFNGKEWTGPWSAGGQLAPGTDPAIARVPNDWWVFYQGSDGAAQQLFYNGKEWTGPFHLGGQMWH
jgi:hypothetical protein